MKKLLSILTLSLTMVQGVWADDKADYGVLNGEFSIAAGKKVHFSQGNLQAFYNSSGSWEWYFAENQWDYVGNAKGNTIINGNGSLSSREYAVDLFGWSTPAETNFYGINNSENNGVYSNAFLDWSKVINFRSIFGEGWFTMSNSEWTYLLNSRTTTTTNMPTGTNSGSARYIKAQVASKNGLILFPDNYAHPAGASVTVSSAAYNTADKGYGSFTVNAENWTKMEEVGAVFLPAGGYRHGTGIIDAGSYGAYWSSTSTSSDKSTSMDFSSSTVEAYNTNRSTGCSVRLVIESHTITYNANGGTGSVDALPKYTGLDRTLSDGTGLSREGYIFDGWATAADGNVVYGPGATYTEDADVTLYAHWTPVNDVTWDATDAEKNNWTISPVNPVAAGAAVTATYVGLRHVKSVTYRPAGTIGGKFTINGSGDKVYFSKGNLQLVGENSWKFADNQWETFGNSQSDNHRDLFGWCTVATPNKTSEDDEDYSSDNAWGNDPYLQACLGTGWHLMVGDDYGEWNYLLNSRTTTSGIRYAVGSVNGKNGLILLPDDWNAEYYALINTNQDNGHYDNNVISSEDWTEKLEAHGAVFLPAGGHRIGTDLFVVNVIGHYWCSSYYTDVPIGDVMRIDEGLILPNWTLHFNYGCSIRLVRDVTE